MSPTTETGRKLLRNLAPFEDREGIGAGIRAIETEARGEESASVGAIEPFDKSLAAIRARHDAAENYDRRTTPDKTTLESVFVDYVEACVDRGELLRRHDAVLNAVYRLTHSNGTGEYLRAFNDLEELTREPGEPRRYAALSGNPETESER